MPEMLVGNVVQDTATKAKLTIAMPPSNIALIDSIELENHPQAHGSLIVAFHPEVLSGYHYLYFPKEGIVYKHLAWMMNIRNIRA